MSFLASKMKTADPLEREDRRADESAKVNDSGGKDDTYRPEEESDQRERDSESFNQEQRYARILGLTEKVTPLDVKMAYRDLLSKYHPDKVTHLGEEFQHIAERKTKEIVEAYEYFCRKYGIR